jgi:long-chain acyl-CoA synthetase
MLLDGFTDLTLARGIRSAAARNPDKLAILSGERRLSYGDLCYRIHKVAVIAAENFRLGPGSTVALIAPNCLEYIELVVGLAEAGARVATLNPRLSQSELMAILADCDPQVVVAHPSCLELVSSAADDIPLLTIGNEYEALLKAANTRRTLPPVPETASFGISYTSGTTGLPKGVLLSHRSRALTAMASAVEYNCFGPQDRFLSVSPLYHGAGFAFALAAVSFGGTCEIVQNFDAERTLARLADGETTGVFLVPTHFHRLFELSPKQLADARGRHALRAIISNASALAQSMKERIIEQFGEGLLHETYGSTEAGIVTNIRPADQLRKTKSVGTPFIHMEVELRRPDGSPSPVGEVGELFCRGPYCFNGYLNRSDETAETLQAGWVTVGDLAWVDAEGFVHIVDRKKDMVVTGGVNVYPREIEDVIAEVPGVTDVAVVGLPDPEWGERLHAFVVGDAPETRILSACQDRLAGFKRPRSVSFLSELPRNASGKLLKKVLREMPLEQF